VGQKQVIRFKSMHVNRVTNISLQNVAGLLMSYIMNFQDKEFSKLFSI